jgi:hypothetical protein
MNMSKVQPCPECGLFPITDDMIEEERLLTVRQKRRIAVLERALENTRHNIGCDTPPAVCDGHCALHQCVCSLEDEG